MAAGALMVQQHTTQQRFLTDIQILFEIGHTRRQLSANRKPPSPRHSKEATFPARPIDLVHTPSHVSAPANQGTHVDQQKGLCHVMTLSICRIGLMVMNEVASVGHPYVIVNHVLPGGIATWLKMR